ncbi:MAG TPA: PIN domain-containing protein [Terracidiphilus sp.]|jgi:predicted nucleic acid-binding protein|nr:PIN domain-containing protein [Terracidiphilus sp.]
MSDRFFLDTNVFVYSFDPNYPAKRSRARELIRKALGSHKGVVSYQVVQEFFNLALRKFAQPLTRVEAEQYLTVTFRPMLSIHSSAALYSAAMRIHFDSGLSWYDSLIVSAAIEADCRTLYTEDLQHGRKFGSLQITNPFL